MEWQNLPSANFIIFLKRCTGLREAALIIKNDKPDPQTTLELIDKGLDVLLINL